MAGISGVPKNMVRGLLPDERGILFGILERAGLRSGDFRHRQVRRLEIMDEARSGKARGTGPGPGDVITCPGREGWRFAVRGMRDAYRTEGLFDFECVPGRVSPVDIQTTKSFHIVRRVLTTWARTVSEAAAKKTAVATGSSAIRTSDGNCGRRAFTARRPDVPG